MITIYTVSSCTSCKKAKTWLNAHQLTYKEQNLGKEGITKEELLDILTKTENGIASIVPSILTVSVFTSVLYALVYPK